jgi:Tfp pilus assembly protein PilX
MVRTIVTSPTVRSIRRSGTEGEHGSALILALLVTLVLAVMALGMLAHALAVTSIAGGERWSLKAFFAADSGLNLAQTRARIQHLAAFQFDLADRRATTAAPVSQLRVQVQELSQVGAPRLVIGSEANAGQGTDNTLVVQSYRTTSTATHQLTGSEREVTGIFGLGPMPAAIPE